MLSGFDLVSIDRLLEFLWRGDPPDTAARHPADLCLALASQPGARPGAARPGRMVVSREPGYLLAVEPNQIDAVRFERLVVDSTRTTVELTSQANRTSSTDAESENAGVRDGAPAMVPPAGFDPALPPPETGRSRDRGHLAASYLVSCSRPVSLVASSVRWFVPRGIPRRKSSVDEFEALLLSESRSPAGS